MSYTRHTNPPSSKSVGGTDSSIHQRYGNSHRSDGIDPNMPPLTPMMGSTTVMGPALAAVGRSDAMTSIPTTTHRRFMGISPGKKCRKLATGVPYQHRNNANL